MRSRPIIAVATACAMFVASTPIPAQAALVSTDSVIAQASAEGDRTKVRDFLSRADVRAQMERMGLSVDEATARVDAMSDDELRTIAGRLDEVPAGGDGLGVVIGAAVLIFVILLITDIAGLTKVFPWTRSVR